LTQSPTCRLAKLKHFNVSTLAAGLNTDVSSFCTPLPAYNHVREAAVVFEGWR
jgi:hypothetical protein